MRYGLGSGIHLLYSLFDDALCKVILWKDRDKFLCCPVDFFLCCSAEVVFFTAAPLLIVFDKSSERHSRMQSTCQ